MFFVFVCFLSLNRTISLIMGGIIYDLIVFIFRMDFPMYVYKPRRGLKRGEDSKVCYHYYYNHYDFFSLLACCVGVLVSRERWRLKGRELRWLTSHSGCSVT